jgi:hypothetical protein
MTIWFHPSYTYTIILAGTTVTTRDAGHVGAIL